MTIVRLQETTGDECGWILVPTRCLDWAGSKRLIGLIGGACLLFGAAFAFAGLWLVGTLFVAQAIAIAVAFYVVAVDGQRREVVRLTQDSLVIEYGARELEHRIEMNRYWVRVDLCRARYRLHPPRLLIGVRWRSHEVGRFLTEDERAELAHEITSALVASHNAPARAFATPTAALLNGRDAIEPCPTHLATRNLHE